MKKSENCERISSSFRDRSGFLFKTDNVLYRQVNKSYKKNYDKLIESCLYQALIKKGFLIPHEEVDVNPYEPEKSYKILKPEMVEFISYPFEWSFSMLKDAALTTLNIQKMSLENGMTLKDCSAYNIQFINGKPMFIDTLSFEEHKNELWIAYRQFCQHFLAPLALMAYQDIRLNQLFRIYIDGIPLDLASSLLPSRTRLRFPLLSHIHIHAKSQNYFSDKIVNVKNKRVSQRSILGLIDNLKSAIKKLNWKPHGTQWVRYYDDTNYSEKSFNHKKKLVEDFIRMTSPKSVWDLGANIGLFSRIASDMKIPTISFDIDPAAVEKNYLNCKKKGETRILPLLLDLTNPSPAIGWANNERMSLIQRGPADTALALALLHHLAISNNLPFERIASFFDGICSSLIIEFIPKDDSQVKRLLATREDIFSDYTRENFENEFSKYFNITKSENIEDSKRVLYLMEKR